MKTLLVVCIGIFCCIPVYARHIRGGELSYRYVSAGSNPNSSIYLVRLKLYIDCNANDPGQNETVANFTIFTRTDNSQYGTVAANKVNESLISYDPASNPCITNPPLDICYKLKYFETTVELPDNAAGYTISYQRCCRIENIENIAGASGNYGATYTCDIPGTGVLPLPRHNSSPVIAGNDAVAICAGSGFSFDFSATDPDGDSLVYSLCNAYQGGGTGTQANGTCLNCVAPNPAAAPPYNSVPYQAPYSGVNPLGLKAAINPQTGIISGIAPSVSAQYVITGCIYEYHDGVLINVHRKDIHLKVSDCNPLRAFLQPNYDYCDDFLVSFKNEQTNPAGSVYIWQFGDGTKTDTSMDPIGFVQHQFADTGTYTIKLKVILAGQCLDSTTTLAKVYPGFYPGFTVTGSCLFTPLQFTDTTKTRYGSVSAWRWNFGDETTAADTSHNQNPQWKFATLGVKTAELIVQSNKGCIDTVSVQLEVKDKPPIQLAFQDTLICSNLPIQDTLMLQASGTGVFSWTPLTRIINANTATPLVFPTTTTVYQVQLNENGCVNTDTVRVRVVDHVTLDAGPDSTICLTDAIALHPSTNALAFAWTPVTTFSNPSVKNPVVTPTAATTVYHLVGSIGKCSIGDDVTIRTVPYPGADAGPNDVICFGDTAQLEATIKGISFNWTPVYSLTNANTLTPLAHPIATTSYVLAVYDVLGCPKPGLDTVVVTVRPPIIAFAGKDTSVTINQPLKLTATGAPLYLWTPATNLDRDDVQSPTALFAASGVYTYAVKAYTQENCFALDTIHIKVFKTAPDIFVPNAFTPGGTQNTLFRPIGVGISKYDYFRVYNRWGLMVFSSSDGSGWNGMYGGKAQASGSYVWVVQGHDFTGKTITKKGVMVLIR